MRILIVAATAAEIAPLQQRPDVEILITGVGMVAAAARTSGALARTRYDLALNLGICGSFDPALSPGTVVHVVSDGMPELGAEDGDTFLSIGELGLLRGDAPPFSNGRLVNAAVPANPVLKCLPAVHGITVNTVHGNEPSIAETVRRFAPQIESMEGAGFMYACLIQAVPFAQVRAVSNMVERRNRSAWKIDEAIAGLCRVAADLIESV
jgi:futalosine hydrolase